jgi:hypothetical protein
MRTDRGTGGVTKRCSIEGRPPAGRHGGLDPIAPPYEDRLPESSGGLGPSASGNARRGHLKSRNVRAPRGARRPRIWRSSIGAAKRLPANEVVNLALLGAEGEVEDYRAVYEQGELRDALLGLGWRPTRHGALLKTLPVHAPNDIFDTTFRLFTLQSPPGIGKTNDAVRLLSDERFVDLEANLKYFRGKARRDPGRAGQPGRRPCQRSRRSVPPLRTSPSRVRPGTAG